MQVSMVDIVYMEDNMDNMDMVDNGNLENRIDMVKMGETFGYFIIEKVELVCIVLTGPDWPCFDQFLPMCPCLPYLPLFAPMCPNSPIATNGPFCNLYLKFLLGKLFILIFITI
jgi:hypothetical protein